MVPIPVLRRVVEERMECTALLRDIVHVAHRSDDGWEGVVVLFSLTGHPSASIAYAWWDPSPSPDRLQLHVALHQGSVDSPEAAVRQARSAEPPSAERVS
jgi:hypothetical protein